MSALASRKFGEEFASMLDRVVSVSTSNGRRVTGRVAAYNPADYSLWLADATTDDGKSVAKMFISGRSICLIEVVEAGPDLTSLFDRINALFPNMARYIREAGVIVVMDRIRVTKDGVIEGSGPAAERIQRIWEEWKRETG
ncbi:MAG: Lsm family RNA-binding protein [Nitrososphaerota archaeon]|nr:Lsm family RNA-binding protein [Candidatus Calditenuaceae archaeon]MDW8072797.1 Lsm family RNA-binding protein [Nitrososphaerota archaeon]